MTEESPFVINLEGSAPIPSPFFASIALSRWSLPLLSVLMAVITVCLSLYFLSRDGGDQQEDDEGGTKSVTSAERNSSVIPSAVTIKPIISLPPTCPLSSSNESSTLGLPSTFASLLNVQTGYKLLEKSLKEKTVDEILATGTSNGFELRWDVLTIPPNTKFPLHAHPNVELVRCVRGVLHEVRMNCTVLENDFDDPLLNLRKLDTGDFTVNDSKRQWTCRSIREGDWMVNPTGSVHKSFTGPEGCELVCLWSGRHADFKQEDKKSFEGRCDCYLRGEDFFLPPEEGGKEK